MQESIIYKGLTQAEAEKILIKDGFNELPAQKKQSWFFMLYKILSEPMLVLLLLAGLVYLFLGDIKDTLVLLFSVFVVIGITFYQERKTEKTLQALKDLTSPRALVIRNQKEIRIPGKEVVKGDIIIIREGDRVPADAVILDCLNLFIDESLLTGESMAVRKTEVENNKDFKSQRPGGDNLPYVYSGSLVTSGSGLAKVVFTGKNTEIGKIGKSLENIKEEDTLLKKETAKIVRFVAIIGAILCILVIAYYAFYKNDLVSGFLAGLTLSMAILPEEFPIVFLIFLTLGAWRISKRNVLTRKSATIETLGAASVLCTDKTGTLTLNKMELSSLFDGKSFYEISDLATTILPENFKNLLKYSFLACKKDAFEEIEKEIIKMSHLYITDLPEKNMELNLVKEYPLSKSLFALSNVWQSSGINNFFVACKGAPESVLELCHINANYKKEILQKVKEMSEKGLRVLAVAKANYNESILPENIHKFDFEFLGLLGFVDPVRPNTERSVKEAYSAGMRVIIITGDYPGTAQFVAEKVGIKNYNKFLTGSDLEKLSHIQLREKIKDVNIFARVVPEQKLLIVNALKANNEIVAMTGDGVNDAPALKSANIGIAMGQRGTDVAREASALVLLDDDFSSIVLAVRLGRRIFENIKSAMGYLLAVHVPIAGMSILPLFFGLPTVMFPIHVAFLELIIDPACSTVFEAEKEDKNIMKRPPRNLRTPMFSFKTISLSILQGAGVLLATFVLYYLAIKSGKTELEARSFAFASLVLSNLTLIVINLSWSKNIHKIILSANKILFFVIFGTLVCLFAVLYVPFLANLFHLAPISPADFIFIFAVVLASLIWFEILKLIRN
jgi:Ca2+-transporting ATPase